MLEPDLAYRKPSGKLAHSAYAFMDLQNFEQNVLTTFVTNANSSIDSSSPPTCYSRFFSLSSKFLFYEYLLRLVGLNDC